MPAPRATKTASKTSYSLAEVEKLLVDAPTALAKLRVPFADEHIELRPQSRSKEDSTKAKSACREGSQASTDGLYCGGWHVPSFHLSFVGHAALTERLLDADERWSWEPMARDEFGGPLLDKMGGLWINLIVDGSSKPGYGDAAGKNMSTTAMKEIIGDALRNAGMRFGMALQLWSKVDLTTFKADRGEYDDQTPPANPVVASGRRGAKAIEAGQESTASTPEPAPDQGIDNPDFDDDTTGAMPKPAVPGIDLENKFVKGVLKTADSAIARDIYTAALVEYGGKLAEKTPEQTAILDFIAARGVDLVAEEAKNADPKNIAAAASRERMKAGFEGQS